MPIWLLAGALLGLSGVALDAVGAHAIVDAPAADVTAFQTAARYQLIHALSLLGVAWLIGRDAGARSVWMAGFAFAAGVVLFSGSIYLRVLLGTGTFSFAAPIGGACLMAGWALLALYALMLLRKSGHK